MFVMAAKQTRYSVFKVPCTHARPAWVAVPTSKVKRYKRGPRCSRCGKVGCLKWKKGRVFIAEVTTTTNVKAVAKARSLVANAAKKRVKRDQIRQEKMSLDELPAILDRHPPGYVPTPSRNRSCTTKQKRGKPPKDKQVQSETKKGLDKLNPKEETPSLSPSDDQTGPGGLMSHSELTLLRRAIHQHYQIPPKELEQSALQLLDLVNSKSSSHRTKVMAVRTLLDMRKFQLGQAEVGFRLAQEGLGIGDEIRRIKTPLTAPGTDTLQEDEKNEN